MDTNKITTDVRAAEVARLLRTRVRANQERLAQAEKDYEAAALEQERVRAKCRAKRGAEAKAPGFFGRLFNAHHARQTAFVNDVLERHSPEAVAARREVDHQGLRLTNLRHRIGADKLVAKGMDSLTAKNRPNTKVTMPVRDLVALRDHEQNYEAALSEQREAEKAARGQAERENNANAA